MLPHSRGSAPIQSLLAARQLDQLLLATDERPLVFPAIVFQRSGVCRSFAGSKVDEPPTEGSLMVLSCVPLAFGNSRV